MNKKMNNITLATLTLIGVLCVSMPISAQVAGGTTTVGVSVVESTQLAMGWSVKKTLMGQNIYNDEGKKVGKVEDLIISPDKNVSYVIVGAGGFIGIGRHDVAIPVMQIQERSGKLVMPNATKDMIKAMPEFTYATDTTRRDRFVTAANQDIAKGKAKVSELEKKASNANSAAKANMETHIKAIQMDITTAEAKVAELKKASVSKWRDFQESVNMATARLRKTIEAATD
jgi:sporulation protein YlmC with PRC-barrel domain